MVALDKLSYSFVIKLNISVSLQYYRCGYNIFEFAIFQYGNKKKHISCIGLIYQFSYHHMQLKVALVCSRRNMTSDV